MDGTLRTTLTPRRYSWLAYVLVGMPDKGMVGFGRGRSNDSTVKAIDDAFFEGESCDRWYFVALADGSFFPTSPLFDLVNTTNRQHPLTPLTISSLNDPLSPL
jgi:hypothetical protein